MKHTFIQLLFLLFFVPRGWGQKVLTLTPEYPQRDHQVTIRYNPGAPGAALADTVSHIEMVFTYSNFYEMPWKMPLTKKGDFWETTFSIPHYGVRATFYLQSGDQKDQPAADRHYEIIVYDKNKRRVKNGYLYEGYSLPAQSRKSSGIAERQAALYREELKNYPDNYEARLRLLAYRIPRAKGKDRLVLKKEAEDLIASQFKKNPGKMGNLNLTTMGYLIIGETSRLDSIRKVVKDQYPDTEAGFELIIDDLKEDSDTAKMVQGLLSLLKKENASNAPFLKEAHSALFDYYASNKQTPEALYHLSKVGKDLSPYRPEILKSQATVLYQNGIAADKALELAQEALVLADTFPVGVIRYFPETGFLPPYVDRETRLISSKKARGNLYSLMALIQQSQKKAQEAGELMRKALSYSEDVETLSNAGKYYHLGGDFRNAFKTYQMIAAEHPEDTVALQNMKSDYVSWKQNDAGFSEVLDQLKDHWNEVMKSELQHQIMDIPAPDFLSKVVDLKGNRVPPSLINNKIVVVDFWATWCVPCMHEMPYLEKAYEKYKNDTNVVFMVVNSGAKNKLSDAQSWWGNQKFSFPVYFNEDPDIGSKLGFNLIPATFIIDAANRIRFKTVGFEGPVIERKIPAAIELLGELKEGS